MGTQERNTMNTHTRYLLVLALAGLVIGGCSSDEAPLPPANGRIPVAQQLTNSDDVFEANPIYSPDGNWILFESDAAGNRDLWRLPATGGTPEQLTTDPAFDSSPYWSPDGGSVVFESERSGGKHIWILDLVTPGAVPVALTSGDGDDGSPAWSPDGTYVVYESNREKTGGSDLWLSPVAGGPALRVTNTPAGVYHRTADWSPDSAQLVFESDRENAQPALFTMDATGGVVRRITPLSGYEGHPAWSPNGAEIAYESTATGTMEIHVVTATGGDPFRVTYAGGFWPRWSPAGDRIVYAVFGDPEPNLWTVQVDR
jgi:TolB protein